MFGLLHHLLTHPNQLVSLKESGLCVQTPVFVVITGRHENGDLKLQLNGRVKTPEPHLKYRSQINNASRCESLLAEPSAGAERVQCDLFMTVQLELRDKRLMPQLSTALAARPRRAGFSCRVQPQFRGPGHSEGREIMTYCTAISGFEATPQNLACRRNDCSNVYFSINWTFIYTFLFRRHGSVILSFLSARTSQY